IGTWQGYEYFSMTLIEGPTLQKQVEDPGFDDHESARLVRDVAIAVEYAHQAGIVHRDLKPENILISEQGRPLVADFGLAKWHREGTMITRTGQVLGTPNYMSPEQACGRGESGVASDIYSLGAVLYAMLTGQPPHTGTSPAEVLRSVLQDEPVAPKLIRRDVAPDLEKICLKAIRYEPESRYESAQALADDLDRYLAGEPAHAAGSGLLDRFAREIRRDQHQSHFEDWGKALVRIAYIILIMHVVMFALDHWQYPSWASFWLPRSMMMLAIIVAVYHARDGALLPRSVAERPVWSIWFAYLMTLGVMNAVSYLSGQPPGALFPIAAALSGFGFVAMAGHVWGGSAIFGLGFFVVAIISTLFIAQAPLYLGVMWFVSLLALARHYQAKRE
ncbi:MAG: serine/threonine-protein kinase, partial [Rubripirellula sp.]